MMLDSNKPLVNKNINCTILAVIKRYKQTTVESCLPVCLLLLYSKEITPEKETDLLFEGLKSSRDNYLVGMVIAFLKMYLQKLTIFADNKYYQTYLKKHIQNKNISILHSKINELFIDQQKDMFILLINGKTIQSFSHNNQHFVIAEKFKDYFRIMDPWMGRIKKIKKENLLKAIYSVKKDLRFCPVVIVKSI